MERYQVVLKQEGLSEDCLPEKAKKKAMKIMELRQLISSIKANKSIANYKDGNLTTSAKNKITAATDDIDDYNDDILDDIATIITENEANDEEILDDDEPESTHQQPTQRISSWF
jgi:hypothetical protein